VFSGVHAAKYMGRGVEEQGVSRNETVLCFAVKSPRRKTQQEKEGTLSSDAVKNTMERLGLSRAGSGSHAT